MKQSALAYLRCPASSAETGALCLGKLSVAASPSPRFSSHDDEITEGCLRCTCCEAIYPIIAGVAVLVPRPFRYVRSFFPFLKGLVSDIGGIGKDLTIWLHKHMLADLDEKHEKLFPRTTPYNEKSTLPMHKWLGTYVLTHYLNPMPSGNGTLDALLNAAHTEGPLALLADMGRRFLQTKPKLAVDLGCSVGGLTTRCAELAHFAIGVDLSFEKILTARRIVLAEPREPDPLRLYREGSSYDAIPIPEVDVSNIEFIVASGTEIPLAHEATGLVSSCNLVDVVADPLKLLQEMERILSSAGLLLVATPYLDHTPAVVNHLEAGTGKPKVTIKEHLSAFDILEERDRVPWLLRASDRHYDLYLDHCFAAIRRAKN